MLRCPYCLDDLLPRDPVVRCATCRTPHHQACFQENEGCTSMGCDGEAVVDAGPSLFLRPALRVQARGREVALGPFHLVWRQLAVAPRTEEDWQRRQPRPWCRLSLEGSELREGESIRGRASLFLPRAVRLRRLELRLTQGLSTPVQVATLQLLPPRAWLAQPRLFPAGRHPFELELRAPPITPHVDPFQLELGCARGIMDEPLVSERQCLFLLQRPLLRPEGPPAQAPQVAAAQAIQLRSSPEAGPPPAMILPPAPPPRPGPDPFAADPFAADPFGPGPFGLDPSLGRDPFGPPSPAREPPGEWDPFATGLLRPPGPVEWRELPLRARGNGALPRTAQARFVVPVGPPRAELELTCPDRLARPELTVSIAGGGALLSLTLVALVELVRPGGHPVAAAGLPATEEVRLLGQDGLDSRRYGPEGVELRLAISPEHLRALEEARAQGAHNAALRLHLALDGLSTDGRVRTSGTRAVTFTGR